MTFLLSNDNAALFSTPPAISADGTLTFTVAGPDINGVAKVTARLQDDGGTAVEARTPAPSSISPLPCWQSTTRPVSPKAPIKP